MLRRPRHRLPLAAAVFVSGAVGRATLGPPDFGIAPPAPPPSSEPGEHSVRLVASTRIVPSDGLPPEVRPQDANNNLDVVRHGDGRVYLAWRSAPSHFASSKATIVLVSSEDEVHWKHEQTLSVGTDLREPRLLSLGGRLFLYVTRLGKNPFSFTPDGVAFTERRADGSWSALAPLDLPGHVVWRVRPVGHRGWMMAYSGGEHLYRFDGVPMHVHLLGSEDGRNWLPLDPGRPSVSDGGGTEADFALTPSGALVGVIRNEAGDGTGAGSKVCEAPAGAPANWECRSDPRKFDSPAMFTLGGETYLVARRQSTPSGHYELSGVYPHRTLHTIVDQLNYIWTGKRCSVWRYVAKERRMAWVLDLPSRGDTCFPSILPGKDAQEVVVYDYSSDPSGPDLVWNVAQRGPTFIYRHTLRFEPTVPGKPSGKTPGPMASPSNETSNEPTVRPAWL